MLFIVLILVIGIASFIGWVIDQDQIFPVNSEILNYSPTMAVLFVLLAFSMFALVFLSRSWIALMLSKAILVLVMIGGLFIFAAYFVDQAFGQSIRVTPVIAFTIAIGGLALYMAFGMKLKGPISSMVPGLLALFVFALGLTGLLGYAFGTPELYFSNIQSISIGSSFALTALGIGSIFVMGPKTWPLFTFFSTRVQDQLLRFLLPLIGATFLTFSLVLSKIVPTSNNPALPIVIFSIMTVLSTAVLVQRLSKLIERRVKHAEEERSLMMENLRRANEKLSILDSFTRHDMLNQLSLSISKAELLRLEGKDSKAVAEIDDLINIDRRIINMLKFSKDYRNVGVEDPKWLNLSEVASNSLLEIGLKGINVRFTCNNVEVFADKMLEKVFFNLLDNAQKHGGKVTEIVIECSQKGDALVVRIKDNGIGIPADMKEKIFEKNPGSEKGLGLLLVRQILSITGISIVEIGIPGKGAIFEMTVPKDCHRKQP